MSLKILLTADNHLGLKFSNYKNVQKELSEARFTTLQSLVHRANSEHCDLFVIAGDLFDHHNVSGHDIELCKNILAEFEGVCLVLPGNHDFFVPGNKLWTAFKQRLGDRIMLLEEKAAVNLKSRYGLDACIWAAPCNAKHSATNNTDWIAAETKDPAITHHIGIAHGSMTGLSLDDKKQYFPMDEEVLTHSGMHLWLMGHTDRLQYPSSVGPFNKVFYPGTHEPNDLNCRHEGKAWLMALDDENKIQAESISCGTYRFIERVVKIASTDEMEGLVAEYAGADAKKMLLRLELTGSLPKDDFQRLSDYEGRLRERVLDLEFDPTRLQREITKDVIEAEFTDGSFPYRLLTRLSEDPADKKALQVAYELIQGVKK